MSDLGSHGLTEPDGLLDVHLRGPFVATQEALRHKQVKGYGRIVFTGSSAGFSVDPAGEGTPSQKPPCSA